MQLQKAEFCSHHVCFAACRLVNTDDQCFRAAFGAMCVSILIYSVWMAASSFLLLPASLIHLDVQVFLSTLI